MEMRLRRRLRSVAAVLATIAATLAFGPARTGHRNEIFFEKCALEGREGGRRWPKQISR